MEATNQLNEKQLMSYGSKRLAEAFVACNVSVV
jgi:hypothetical protein